MSGDAFGVIFGLTAGAVYATGWLAFNAAKLLVEGTAAAVNAVIKYQQKRNAALDYTCDGVNKAITDLYADMQKQHIELLNGYNELKTNLESESAQIAGVIKADKKAAVADIINNLNGAADDMRAKITNAEKTINEDYMVAVTKTINSTRAEIDKDYNTALNSIKAVQAGLELRKTKAKEAAEFEIYSAKGALDVLKRNYHDAATGVIKNALTSADNQYAMGNYEAAFASAHNCVVAILDETLKADKRRREHEMKVSNIIVLLEQALNAMKQRRYVRCEDIDRNTYQEDLADFSSGMYNAVMKKISDKYDLIIKDELDKMSTAELDVMDFILRTELIPEIDYVFEYSQKNLVNTYQREALSGTIVSAMEDQDYTLIDDANRADNRGEDMHLVFENKITGEKVLVKLCPEDDEKGDIHTKLEIKMIEIDDPGDEIRKKEIRDHIDVCVKKELNIALHTQCDVSTKNKASSDVIGADLDEVKKRKTRKGL